MATISSLGTGSGLDLESLVTKLMQVEQQPLVDLNTKEARVQARISALGSLKSAISTLQSAASGLTPATGQTAAAKFSTAKATVADTTYATAGATTSAVPGTYSLEVTTLAQNHRLVSPSGAYTSSGSAIATGTLVIELGSVSGPTFTRASGTEAVSVTIDSGNNTLAGLRDAINAAGAGITATIVTGTGGARLVLTAKDSGTGHQMRLSGLTGFDFDPVAATGTLSQAPADGGQAASDAALKLNGIAITSSSNTVTEALDGVTINLLKQTTSATTLTVSKDSTGGITSGMTAFVKAYNEAVNTISQLGGYNAETKEAGTLNGNATLRVVQSQLRSLVFSTPAGATGDYRTLSSIGVGVQRNGTLLLDSSKLQAALADDPDGVMALAAGFGKALTAATTAMTGSTGVIAAGTDGLNRTVTDIDKQRQRLADRLTQVEARYRAQFTALDSLVASMKSTSAYLTQQLAAITSSTSSSS
ncbi:MAG: flagellar filament capping protein FliD [Rhodocyclaceae bacterium]|nr:flagellar filament capping protein FliD [Rhodocyclaceae bacterium]